jgi:CubicO group peptidase (beta-lactamase class C family)
VNIVVPETVGLSSARLARLEAHMQRYVDEGKLAGLITLLARRGQVAHLVKYGSMDIEAGKAMQLDTLFRIYSMSKPIASVAAMMLYEEGHVLLTDPVSRFIPAFKEAQVYVGEDEEGVELAPVEPEIAIWHLLTHTSGLVYPMPEGSPVERMLWKADQESGKGHFDWPLEELCALLASLPLAHQPGSAWTYGFSTDVLGRVVEIVSGQPFDAFLEERVFQPLGMVDTSFYVPESKLERFAANYGPAEEGGLKLIDAPATSVFAKPVAFLSGGGGLISTTGDYWRFCQMLLNGGELEGTRLLSPKTVALMRVNHLPAGLAPFAAPSNGFGLGFDVTLDVGQTHNLGSVGDYGWGGAASTTFRIDPQEEMVRIMMTQFMPNGHFPLAPEFAALSYQAIVD